MDADIALLQEAGEPAAGGRRANRNRRCALVDGRGRRLPGTALANRGGQAVGARRGGVDRGESSRCGGAWGTGSQPPGHPRRCDRDGARQRATGVCLHVRALGVTTRRHRQCCDYLGRLGPAAWCPTYPPSSAVSVATAFSPPGDLNILHGHGDYGSAYWAALYATVFTRMAALGLPFIGPQAPHGRQAEPWPDELPPDSPQRAHLSLLPSNSATRRHANWTMCLPPRAWPMRCVFAPLTRSSNGGPSDHCRLVIDVP